MKTKIGQSFEGRFHKELPVGTLVRLDSPFVTGLVKDKLEGEAGDAVRVRVDSVDVEKGHIDLSVSPKQEVEGFLLNH